MKKKVKITESIAGMADPKPKSVLDQKYSEHTAKLKAVEKPPSIHTINQVIDDMKKRDRYGEPMLGFPRDWSFKPGDEVLIDADLADKWQEAGICQFVEESAAPSKKAA